MIFKKTNLKFFLENYLRDNNLKDVLLVRGRNSFVHSGAEDLFSDIRKDFVVTEYSDFQVNPREEDAIKGSELLKTKGCKVIISVGGGSVIDMAKLIRYYATDKFENENHNISLIAIPTTSGTGAESTHFAVCYVDGVKKSIAHEKMLPNIALLCPELTYGNNAYLTACTGFDAFAQAIEAYWNVNSTTESDTYALEAILLLQKSLPLLVKDLDNHALRDIVCEGSNFAGRAINITKTTAPHAMSYTLTSKYGYPHGHAVALTFPFFFNKNINCNEEDYVGKNYSAYRNKINELKTLMPIDEVDALTYMKGFVSSIGLDYDAERSFDDEVVESGINLERAKNNPMRLSKDLIREAVKSIKK